MLICLTNQTQFFPVSCSLFPSYATRLEWLAVGVMLTTSKTPYLSVLPISVSAKQELHEAREIVNLFFKVVLLALYIYLISHCKYLTHKAGLKLASQAAEKARLGLFADR